MAKPRASRGLWPWNPGFRSLIRTHHLSAPHAYQRLQEVTVPRYSARIFDGNLPTISRSRYIWAPTESEAARQAQDWLRVVRATQSRMRSLDTWTISFRLSPHRAPEVILSGTIPAVT